MMFNAKDLEIPKGQPGYLSKSDIAKILKDKYSVDYSSSQLKKTKREDLVEQIKKLSETAEKPEKTSKKSDKFSFRSTLNRMFSIFRY